MFIFTSFLIFIQTEGPMLMDSHQVTYLLLDVALETQAVDGGFVRHGDPSGCAGVPQVVLVNLPLSGSHDQTSTIQSKIHRGEWTLHPDGLQNTWRYKTRLAKVEARLLCMHSNRLEQKHGSLRQKISHFADCVVADDLLVEANADHQQLAGRREDQARGGSFVAAVKDVDLFLRVGVPQDHGAAVRNAAQQRTLQRRQPQLVDGLQMQQEEVCQFNFLV